MCATHPYNKIITLRSKTEKEDCLQNEREREKNREKKEESQGKEKVNVHIWFR